MPWMRASPIETERLRLEPLDVGHASEMRPVLSAPELTRFTGGEPPTEDELRARYLRQSAGQSPSGDAGWLNWIVRRRDVGAAVGYVQATVTEQEGAMVADVAWVIGVSEQRRGFASEAAEAMLEWTRLHGVSSFDACIHPENRASAGVARRLGFVRTDREVAGEAVWELRA
ncbi:GNAT family N-acetyltransferase [Leucobacter sp. HNU]|uniref:GNAT family N-acetyltransferase n=1 Tax=Leucobacter sp. HNU TaxID=3236805 RepID=UPI003A80567E